jgi:type II secretory pathway pseudopilin PulG
LVRLVRRTKRSESGFTLIEILITTTILFISLQGLLSVQKTIISGGGRVQKQQDIANILAQRLNYFRTLIKNQVGSANFLRLYATSSGSIGVFNPILDLDPNQNFSQAFSDGTTTIANPEKIAFNGHLYSVTYQITLQTTNYDSASGIVQATNLSFPNSTVSLSQVGLIIVSAIVFNTTDSTTQSFGEADIALF